MTTKSNPLRKAFSLVEVLAAVSIIGIIAFLAIPNIIAIKKDSERNLAISRAEAVNMAIVSYIQSNGKSAVAPGWTSLTRPATLHASHTLPCLCPSPVDRLCAGWVHHDFAPLAHLTYQIGSHRYVGTATIAY